VCELSDHLPSRAVLNEQGVFAADLVTPRDIGDFDKQDGIVQVYRGHTTVDDTRVRMHFGRSKVHFIRVVVSGCDYAAEYFAQLGFVVNELQQGLATRPRAADAENVFCCGIYVDYQQAVIKKDDA